MRMVTTSVFDEVQAEYYIFCLLLLAYVCVCLLLSRRDFLSILANASIRLAGSDQKSANRYRSRPSSLYAHFL